MSYVIGLLLLCVLVVFHELGHFLAAKSFGICVERFSIGFGKALLEWKRGGTVYAVAVVPLGGYVKMKGENPDEATEAPDSFSAKPWWQRFVVVTAGPIANLIFAFFLNSMIGFVGVDVPLQPAVIESAGEIATEHGFLPGDQIVGVDGEPVASWYGVQEAVLDREGETDVRLAVERQGGVEELLVPDTEVRAVLSDLVTWADTRVGRVSVGMPAYQGGMEAGDRVIEVDEVAVQSWSAMRDLIASRPGEKLTLRVERDGQERLLTMKTLAQETDDGVAYGLIGIEPDVDYERRRISLGQSIGNGVTITRGMIGDVYGGFWMLVTKPGSFKDNVAGPLTIAKLAGSSTRPSQMLYVLAFISMALMALNLLPIPILDGGHAMFCLIEGVRGKKLSDRSQLALQKVGLVLIGSLVVMALFNDVKRVWERNQAVRRIERQETGESP